MKLTKLAVEALTPGTKDAYLWDPLLPGFGVKVTPTGSRVYLVQYRRSDTRQTRRYTIGRHGAPWTTEKARSEASRLLARIKLGQDPVGELQAARTHAAVAASGQAKLKERVRQECFEQLRASFIETYAKPRNKRWDEAQRILSSPELDSWRPRLVADISRRDVRDAVDVATSRAPGAGRLLFAHLRKFFAWCAERMYVEASPCGGLKGPGPSPARDRNLNDAELFLVWRGFGVVGDPFGPLFKLLLLTAQRREEVSGMRWAEVDLDRAEWTIPAARTKNARAHEVDLAPAAVAILRVLPRTGDLVFTTTGTTPISGHSKAKARLDLEVERLRSEATADVNQTQLSQPVPPWRVHDLRRTAASGMAALGHPPHVIETVLNHVSGARGGLVGVYQRYQYRPERKAALLGWANHIASVVTTRAP